MPLESSGGGPVSIADLNIGSDGTGQMNDKDKARHMSAGTLFVGQRETASMLCSPERVRQFAELTGDHNPLYFDEHFTSMTRFRKPIVQAPLYTSLLDSIIGMRLPGPGTVLVYQEHNFYKPLFVGEKVVAEVTVASYNQDQGIVHLDLGCFNQSKEILMRGKAVILLACR